MEDIEFISFCHWNSTKSQKLVLKWKISRVKSSHFGPMVQATLFG
jgi:hypothetical protein